MLKGMETEQQNLKLPNSSTPPKLSSSGSKCLLPSLICPKEYCSMNRSAVSRTVSSFEVYTFSVWAGLSKESQLAR